VKSELGQFEFAFQFCDANAKGGIVSPQLIDLGKKLKWILWKVLLGELCDPSDFTHLFLLRVG